jgi:hypothetical protein
MDNRFIKTAPNQIDYYIEACKNSLTITQWWTMFKELLHKLGISSMKYVFENASIHPQYVESCGLIFMFNYSLHSPWNQLSPKPIDELVASEIERKKEITKIIVTNGFAFHVYTIRHLESKYPENTAASDGLNLDSKLASILGYKPLLQQFLQRTLND